jgi:hypothetical protein
MIGQVYTHKNTGERMKVVRFSNGIATCERIDKNQVWYSKFQIHKYPCAICVIENLIPIEAL